MRLEPHLADIVIEILIAAEYQYRDFLQWCYALSVRDSEEPLERGEKERFNQITKLMVMEK